MPDVFDPRANHGKRYVYHISTSDVRDPLQRLYSWHLPPRHGRRWDLDAAYKGAAVLQNDFARNFSAFANTPRGAERQRKIDPFCTLREVRVVQTSSTSVTISFRADRFLYKMARNLVGALVGAGYRELGIRELEQAITSGRFSHTDSPGLTAPAQGLFLERVFYGENDPFRGHFDNELDDQDLHLDR